MYANFAHIRNSLEELNQGSLPVNAVLEEIKATDILNSNAFYLFTLISNYIKYPSISDGIKSLLQGILSIKESEEKEIDFLVEFSNYLNSYQKTLLRLSGTFTREEMLTIFGNDNTIYSNCMHHDNDEMLIYQVMKGKRDIPEILSCLTINYDKLDEIFKNGAPIGSVRQVIRTDNVEQLIQLETQPDFSLRMKLTPSALDKMYGTFTLIEYAAIYGAIKCFKHILLAEYTNNEPVLRDPKFAISGGNLEIIHLLMKKGVDFLTSECARSALYFNNMDFLEWIIDQSPEFLKDQSQIISLIHQSIAMYNFYAFELLYKRVEPIMIFNTSLRETEKFCVFFMKIIEDEKEKGKLNELFEELSKAGRQWFHKKWFPTKYIQDYQLFTLIENSMNLCKAKDIKTLLDLNPTLNPSDEKALFEKGNPRFLEILLSYERFVKYAHMSFDEFDQYINTLNKDFLPLLSIEEIANQTDENGNNFLQRMFANFYLHENLFSTSFRGKDLGKIVTDVAMRVNIMHKNNDGKTAADILSERPYNQITLIMMAEFRTVFPDYPYQELPLCSFVFTKRNYYEQPFYSCDDCDLTDGYGCCEACVSKCHGDHKVHYNGIRNCFCDCIVLNKHKEEKFPKEKEIKEENPQTSSSDTSDATFTD